MNVHEYVEGYEFRGDLDYTPNDHEKALIEDAILGYLGLASPHKESVGAVAAIIAKWVDEERFSDAPAFQMAAREIIAALSPPPTVGAEDEAVALPESTELPPMTDRGIAGQIMDVAWPHYGGSNQPADFWHDFGEGVRFALHYTRPSPSAVEVKE